MQNFFAYIFLIKALALGNTALAQLTSINGPAGSGQFGFSITVLTNGNFVVADPFYDEGALTDVGAVYLYDGITYALISTLKGSSVNDNIGSNGVLALGNGNFVVNSTLWDNGAATNAGAVTWGSGTTGVSGIVSSSNSLVGSSSNDNVGSGGVVDPVVINNLRTGNYMVRSPLWDNGTAVNAGAFTWGNGNSGVSGVLSSINSLVGSSSNDNVGVNILTSFSGVSNTSLVIRSPDWDNGAVANAGAVTWINGMTGITGVISSANSLVGTTANDKVGFNPITILSNGNYVVTTPDWDNGGVVDAGAVTWGSGTTGITGPVNSANSLVGGTAGNNVGSGGVTGLNNGNYIVQSPGWDNGVASDAGAVTWGNGISGVVGIVSSSNSLVGTSTNDKVGNFGAIVLANNNYVVRSPYWHNGTISNAGAVTWGNGTMGINGPVSSTNSLVGISADDRVGGDDGTITTLNNGNYVIRSPYWNDGAITDVGAATWGNGATGISGTINSSNSLIGSSANDFVSINGIMALFNDNYVVRSASWSNGTNSNAGAVTWGNGTTGVSGTISSSNSLIGTTLSDGVGTSFLALNNGHYVIGSLYWNNGTITDAGAVTWCNGVTGTVGIVTSSNSLVGTSTNDNVGSISQLSNNNYLISSSFWDNGGAADAGAVTWCNGSGPVTGVVSSANSLIGSSANDRIGSNIATSLSEGIYVVNSSNWDNGAIADAGAVSVGNSITGIAGVVSGSNSMVGSSANDRVGSGGAGVVNNNIIIISPFWDNGGATDAGAVSWINDNIGLTGPVSSANSLVGSVSGDNVGSGGAILTSISNPHRIIRSPNWDNGAISNTGAATFANGSTGVYGTITACNSVPGLIAAGGSTLVSSYNNIYEYMLVGKRQENLVVIYNPVGMVCANNLDATSTNINGFNQVPLIASSGCRIISSITPSGANPISGTVNSKLWIEASTPTLGGIPFVSRHYEITPLNNPETATGRVTLYFLQQEFNEFNTHIGSVNDLPTNANDVPGKANLRIWKYSGASNDNRGMPYSYSGGITSIDPQDNNIVWNPQLSRWEITIDVTGFSGFFVSTSDMPNFTLCPSSVNTIIIGANGAIYQWQLNTGSGYNNLSDGVLYNGTATPALTITGLPSSSYGYKYRCVVDGLPGTEYEIKFSTVWIGSVSTDWFTGSNWSGCGNIPDQYTDVIIPGGANNYPIINTNTMVRSLKAEPGASVTLQTGVTVTILQ